MSFFEGLFGKARPTSSSVKLTKKEVDDAVNDFLIDGNPNPSNQQIAEKLGRTILEVNVFRRYVPSVLHTRYDSDSDDEDIGKSTTQGGRKNNKTISNKNKKKHKKLSRRRSNKKNRKSMKRK
jgi:hypothetical protein